MVRKNFNGVWTAVEVVSPFVQSSNDAQEFAVVDLVVALCGIEGLRDVRAGVHIAIGICLAEESSGCELGCIAFNGEGLGFVCIKRTGAVTKWFRMVSKACCSLSVHFHGWSFFVKSCRGRDKAEKLAMNLR